MAVLTGSIPIGSLRIKGVEHLADGGLVGVEFGWDQLAAVQAIFESAGFAVRQAVRDYGGRDRALIFGLKRGNSGE